MTAETSTGKSAFMAYMAKESIQMGNNVLYFSFEMVIDECARGIEISINISNPVLTMLHYRGHSLSTIDNLKDFTKFNTINTKTCQYLFRRYGNHFHIIRCGLDDISANDYDI